MPFSGVVDVINNLTTTKKVIFLSNAPRTAEMTCIALQSYGINTRAEDIVTSSDIARIELKRNLSKKIYHICDDKNQDLLRDIDVNVVTNISNADLLLLSVFVHESEQEDKFDTILHEAVKQNLPLICTNPDTYVPNGYCAGVFAKKYKKMGGAVTYYGKPYPQIFEVAYDRCGTEKSKILMIGDTFETDVVGAAKFGIDVALTLTGNGVLAYKNLSERELQPTYVIEGLW